MDDVLDCVRLIHLHRDVHRRLPIMVPILLRGEDSARALASLASYQRIFHSVPEVCTPGPVQAGTGV